MKEIGDILRRRREEMKFTHAYVNAQTHIPLTYITALEEGDVSVFPAQIYFLGSLRRYARFLGLNDEDVVGMYRRKMSEANLVQKSPVSTREIKLSGSFFALLLTAAIVVAGGLFVWIGHEISLLSLVSKAGSTLASVKQEAGQSKGEPLPAVALKRETLILDIECVEDAWVKVSTDEKVSYEGTLLKGERKQWSAGEKFYLSVGYVPGIKVRLNGKPIDISVGAKHDVNSLKITKDTFEVLRGSEPAHGQS